MYQKIDFLDWICLFRLFDILNSLQYLELPTYNNISGKQRRNNRHFNIFLHLLCFQSFTIAILSIFFDTIL